MDGIDVFPVDLEWVSGDCFDAFVAVTRWMVYAYIITTVLQVIVFLISGGTEDFMPYLYVHGCGQHSVASTGDLLLMAPIGLQPGLHIGDIVAVKDDRRKCLYVQKVTDLYQPSGTGIPSVEIQYEPEGSGKLERRCFVLSDVVGRVKSNLPYIGWIFVLYYRLLECVAAIVYHCARVPYLLLAGNGFIVFSVVLLGQVKLVT